MKNAYILDHSLLRALKVRETCFDRKIRYLNIQFKWSAKIFWTKTGCLEMWSFPCWHTTSFQRWYDVQRHCTTSYRRWNNVVSLRDLSSRMQSKWYHYTIIYRLLPLYSGINYLYRNILISDVSYWSMKCLKIVS